MVLSRRLERFILFVVLLLATTILDTCRFRTLLLQQDRVDETPQQNDDFGLAFEESLGFFDDIPRDLWTRRKNITNKHIHNGSSRPQRPYYMRAVTAWYQENWNPDFVCFHEENVGMDGQHKWVCDPHRLNKKKDCLVYSFGSKGDFKFEVDLQKWAPLCEMHIFDVDDYSERVKDSGLTNAFFHPWGIKSSYANPSSKTDNKHTLSHCFKRSNCKTLKDTIQQLGHEGRTIDVFKIDCKGCEWRTYQDFLGFDIRQILIETHHVVHATQDFFTDLHKAGYVIFHQEYSGGKYMDFSFLKLSKSFFQ